MKLDQAQQFIGKVEMNVEKFLNHMYLGDGYFKFSYHSDLTELHKEGLAQISFAVKLAYMIDSPLINNDRDILAARILSFKKSSGAIVSPTVLKNKKKYKLWNLLNYNFYNSDYNKHIRSETRQSYESLILLKNFVEQPLFILKKIDKKNVEKFCKSLDWTNPWDAGSHLSGLMFFIAYYRKLKIINEEEFKEYKRLIFNELDSIKKEDGFWCEGQVEHNIKVNGLMKICLGLYCWGDFSPVDKPKKLIEECLKFQAGTSACDYMNVLWCLYCLTKLTKEKKEEVVVFALNILDLFVLQYYENEGGFSFYKESCFDVYHGVKFAEKEKCSDLHGTYILVWGLSLVSEILNFDSKLRHPVSCLINKKNNED